MKCVFLGLVFAAIAMAAGEFRADAAGEFRADANVVLVNTTVLDRHDRPVRGLGRDQFRLYQDQAEQRIAYFAEEETPLSLAVVFDVSGSMDSKMAWMRAALDAVLRRPNSGDEFSLITFSGEPRVAAGWSADVEEVQSQVLLASAHGETSLLDALELGLVQLRQANNARKAMLILSDGGDNHSRYSEGEVTRSLAEAGVQIYAIDSVEPEFLRARSPEEFAGPDLLGRLCDQAGGRYFQVDGKREIAAAAEQISLELRSQYLIGYVPPPESSDGRFHHLRVQLKRDPGVPKLSVFSRPGYRISAN
jgi:Ca-activated chloride channel family protein